MRMATPLAGVALLASTLATLTCTFAHAEPALLHWRMVGSTAAWGTGGMEKPDPLVIRDRKAFGDAWKRLYTSAPVVPEAPVIDFSREMVIVLAAGASSMGGTSIQSERIMDFGDELKVMYEIVSAGRDCMRTQSITAPVLVLRVKRVDKPVSFAAYPVVRDCK